MLSQTKIGRYEVIAPLGQGAMGTVYKAVDPLIERTVAIKTINLNLSKEERAEFEERFYREAKSAGRLNHSNIVTIYDVGETDDIAYIAMEYLEGESLREMLDSGVVLPVEMIGKIVARIASALNYAHENHVVHRDIKPANIMITSKRDVKIMDFGIAQIPMGSRTQLGTVLGSPKYMAPEQVAGQATDGKTDIFALGVVLYEMLTGTTPFNGDNLSAIMYKILNEEPAPPSTINPRVPPVFDRVVSRALSKRPEDRYQTAREFARDLRNQAAVPSQSARQLVAGAKPPGIGAATKVPAGPQDATVLLKPHQARDMMAEASKTARAGNGASPAGSSLKSRKALLIALPVVAIAALVVLSQYRTPQPARMPAPAMPIFEAAPDLTAEAQAEIMALAPEAESRPAKQRAPAEPVASRAAVARTNTISASRDIAVPVVAVQAKLSFAISPWGEVFIDGSRVGVSPPLSALQLEPGMHKIEIRNQPFSPYRETVSLDPGESLKIRHKFR